MPMPMPMHVLAARRIRAHLPPHLLAKLRSCAPPGAVIEDVTFDALVKPHAAAPGGFVVVDTEGWHFTGIAAVARRAAEAGARLVLYSSLTTMACKHVNAAVMEVAPATGRKIVPEVVLTGTDDSREALSALLRSHDPTVPAFVLAGLGDSLERLADPVGSRMTSYFAWAPIPNSVATLCEVVALDRQAVLARLHASGLGDTEVVLEVARVAAACQRLFCDSTVAAAADESGFGSERTMRDAFARRLAAAPSVVRRDGKSIDVADKLVAAATHRRR